MNTTQKLIYRNVQTAVENNMANLRKFAQESELDGDRVECNKSYEKMQSAWNKVNTAIYNNETVESIRSAVAEAEKTDSSLEMEIVSGFVSEQLHYVEM